MWLIFCGACDNRPWGGSRRRKCERQWLKKKAPSTMEHRKFNLLQCLFCCKGCCLWLSAVGSDARWQREGHKKRDKIFKTLQLEDITFIHKLCMRGCYHIFFLVCWLFILHDDKHVFSIFFLFIHIFIRRRHRRRRLRQFFHLVPKYKLE